jgi:putative sterol carrier protein
MSVSPEMGYLLVNALQPMIEAVNPASAPAGAGAAAGAPASLDAWFLGLPKQFKADAAGDMKAVYFFDVTGEGGGNYAITIANGQCTVEKAKPEKPDLTITIAAPDMMAITTGELDPMAAFMTGKLKIDGDMSLAMKMGDLFFSK